MPLLGVGVGVGVGVVPGVGVGVGETAGVGVGVGLLLDPLTLPQPASVKSAMEITTRQQICPAETREYKRCKGSSVKRIPGGVLAPCDA